MTLKEYLGNEFGKVFNTIKRRYAKLNGSTSNLFKVKDPANFTTTTDIDKAITKGWAKNNLAYKYGNENNLFKVKATTNDNEAVNYGQISKVIGLDGKAFDLDGEDLNTITTTGVYSTTNGATATSANHYPDTVNQPDVIWLRVTNANGIVTQELKYYGIKNTKFIRLSKDNGTTWEDWNWEAFRGETISHREANEFDSFILSGSILGDSSILFKKAVYKGVIFDDIVFLSFAFYFSGFSGTGNDSGINLQLDLKEMLKRYVPEITGVTVESYGSGAAVFYTNNDFTGTDSILSPVFIETGDPNDTMNILNEDLSNMGSSTWKSLKIVGSITININYGE
jgi:hypothetical protein